MTVQVSNKQQGKGGLGMSGLSQNQKVLNHLKTSGAITSMSAFSEYKITRLAARISDLRDAGYSITSNLICTTGNAAGRYAEYTLD